MTFPAARRGDSTTHGGGIHGSGYAKVRVGGKSAWRVGDMHICRQLNPPPPSNPHGPGMVLKGSFTVLIGGQPAARQSDVIMEPAAVVAINPIASGETTVLIGDLAFGLMTDAVLDAFCAKWTQLLNDWPTLTEDERKKRAEEAVNAALDQAGVPKINGIVDSASAAANAAYSRFEHRIFLPNGFFRSPTPPASRFGRSLIHEARHAEQAYNAGRYLAQKGWSARRLQSTFLQHPNLAVPSARNPVSMNSAAGQHGKMFFQEQMGAGKHGQAMNNNIRDAQKAKYDNPGPNTPEYRQALQNYYGLPSEADARATEAALMRRCPASR